MSIEKIIENVERMREIFKKYDFEKVRLFKGFSDSDRKTFYLVASLTKSEDWRDEIDKKSLLSKELMELLGCYVDVTLDAQMDPGCSDKVNAKGGSVNLSEVRETSVVEANLIEYFGSKNWDFDKLDPNEKAASFPKVPKHPKQLFNPSSQEANKNNQKTTEALIAELEDKISGFTISQLLEFKEATKKLADDQMAKLNQVKNRQG